ncbi:uncharacterized protein LOC115774906 [Archocentrus centrarchus]|uniref:uncharacterized protein LOC115774906 n=1 Tax=Archocentrus centrarchus TaxID=63155 RepID=UPI0011EA35E9|nr:uncharacterized protein LOC115774906 [Archocentrus centrarchus]
MLECISRVALLSQSANITEITKQYLLELLGFAKTFPETNPKDVLFYFHEQWELRFFRSKKWMAETNSVPPAQVPSEAEIVRALKKMLSHLASSTEENVARKSPEKKSVSIKAKSGGKKPPLSPRPPPCDKRQTGRAIPTRRVSTVRVQQHSNVTSDEVKKTPKRKKPPTKEAGERQKGGDYYLLTLDKSRHKRVLWTDRERIKPIQQKTSQHTALSLPVSPAPNLPAEPNECQDRTQFVHIIRYQYLHIRHSEVGPSCSSCEQQE